MVLRLSYRRILRRAEASRSSLASVGSTGAGTDRSGAFKLANAASRIGAALRMQRMQSRCLDCPTTDQYTPPRHDCFWVNRVISTVVRPLPACPINGKSSGHSRTSASCHQQRSHTDRVNEKERPPCNGLSMSNRNRSAVPASSSQPRLRPCGSRQVRGWGWKAWERDCSRSRR